MAEPQPVQDSSRPRDLKYWHALTPEAALEPSLPILDAHHHFWDRPDRRYLLGELLADFGSHNVVSTIFVECRTMYRKSGAPEFQPLGETEFVLGFAAMAASGQYGPTAVAEGIVGYADLRMGDGVAPVLEAHLAIAPSRFKGVRYGTLSDPDSDIAIPLHNSPPTLMSDATFRRGLACLGRYGLVFDAAIFHHQIPALLELARAVPGTNIVVNHLACVLGVGRYRNRRDEVFAEWKKDIALLAQCDNVFMKLGGMGVARCGMGWDARAKPPGSEELAAALAPYYDYCIEQFGPRRCMLESNFPADARSYSYPVLWNAHKRVTAGYSASERAALFHDTAARVYRLGGT